jgi:hypothetical protein
MPIKVQKTIDDIARAAVPCGSLRRDRAVIAIFLH